MWPSWVRRAFIQSLLSQPWETSSQKAEKSLAGSWEHNGIYLGVCALKKVPAVSDPSIGKWKRWAGCLELLFFSLAKSFLTRNVPKLDARGKICLGWYKGSSIALVARAIFGMVWAKPIDFIVYYFHLDSLLTPFFLCTLLRIFRPFTIFCWYQLLSLF